MKKSVLYVLILFLALNSCSMDDLSDDLTDDFNDSDIIKEYFKDWDITIPYQDVSETKTFQLLDALIEHIDKNQIFILFFPSSDLFYPSVTKFNEHIWNNKEAAALFEREDCAFVLISTYQKYLKMKRFNVVDDGCVLENKWLNFFDYVLTSEMCMSKFNINEKVQLMVLALEKSKYGFLNVSQDGHYVTITNFRDYSIMFSIMLSSNYDPFVSKVKPMLFEFSSGASYGLLTSDGTYLTGKKYNDFITGYAKQFINKYK